MFEYKKVYFIGIGGIGMSALAQMMKSFGIEVLGSDQNDGEVAQNLKQKGIRVNVGQNGENIPEDVDCVVYTLAIKEDNSEFIKAKELNVPMYTYAQMLGKFSRGYFTIAISGTHGKTTTTAMIENIFDTNNRKPYTIVGSILTKNKTNYVEGEEKIFIVEACEYQKSFLNLKPNILVITNIDLDHLDFYKDLPDIQNAFRELIDKMPEDGVVICDPKDSKVAPVIAGVKQKIIDYTEFIKDVPTEKIMGDHNVLNSAASLAVSNEMKLDHDLSIQSFSNFLGTWRRFEYKGITKEGVLIYDDYAHHPKEIEVTLKTLSQKFHDKRTFVIFQSHTYSRTFSLFKDFVSALGGVYEIILVPIYAAREQNTFGVTAEQLCEEISKKQNCKFFPDFDKVKDYIKTESKAGDLVMTMGAGDVYKIGEDLLN